MRLRILSTLALLTLVAGCAGPSARISSSPSSEYASALPATRELSGTWHGNYWQTGMVFYLDDADCTLRITKEATFTNTCTRSSVGTNNIAKSSSWSGRVVTKGNELILKDDSGIWPSIVLRRSADNTLYGVTLDPLTGATVEINFEHAPSAAASAGPGRLKT